MLIDGVLPAAVALGHLCLMVLAINVVHGIGFSPRGMRWVKWGLLLGLAVVTGALAGVAGRGGWNSWPGPVRVYAVACAIVALFGLPAVTIARRLRRPPPGIAGRAEEIDLAGVFGAEALIGRGRKSWWLRLPGNSSFRLLRRQWSVAVDGLPPACEGLSLVHLSDLHFDRSYGRRFFEVVADEAGRWEADLVVFTGDLFDDDATLDWVVPVLSRLRGRRGQYAILGNHDYRQDAPRAVAELERAGFVVLDGRWTRLDLDGATLALGGTSAPWGPDLDPAAMPAADLRIVLSHTPDRFYRLASWGADLVLCGHNHGGQYRLPIIGPVLMPSLYSRRFDRGFFRRGRSLMYVSQGIGAEHPLRVGCPPEIARLVLRAPRPSSRAEDRRRVESLQSVDEMS